MSEPYDARLPQLGFIGKRFNAGGIVLMTINPGGGGDTYTKTAEDQRLLPMIDKARSEPFNEGLIEEIFEVVVQNMRTWNLWRIVRPTLDACGLDQSQVAILNWCPFRTRNDAMPLAAGECPTFCVWLIGSMLPERSKDDDDFERTAGRAAEGLQAA